MVLGWDSLPHHCRNLSNRTCKLFNGGIQMCNQYHIKFHNLYLFENLKVRGVKYSHIIAHHKSHMASMSGTTVSLGCYRGVLGCYRGVTRELQYCSGVIHEC